MNHIICIFLLLFTFHSEAGVTVVNSEMRKVEDLYELTSYNDQSPPEIILPQGSRLESCVFAGRECSGPRIILKLKGQVPQTPREAELRLQYSLEGESVSLRLRLFPATFPCLMQEGRSRLKNPLIFSISSFKEKQFYNCHLFVLSPEGSLRFYRSLDKVCMDFRPHRVRGKVFYSYAISDEVINHVGYLGPRMILDESFREIKTVAPLNDMHEFLLLGLEHWVGFEFSLARLSSGKVYLDKRIREWKNGELIFDWGASDIIRQFGSEAASNIIQSEFRGEVVAELFHMNSLQRIGEEGFVVGLGHDGVGYLDKKTKRLTWVLGGLYDQFNLRMKEHPLFNHTPTLSKNGELTLFSNRSWETLGSSPPRVLRYQLDLKKKKLKSFKVLRVKEEFVHVMGSLQVTGETLSIGFGSKDLGAVDFIEMHESGRENWKMALEKGRTVYRFYREPHGE